MHDLDLSQLKQGCSALHEYYTELRHAGFTRLEALYIVTTLAAGGPKPPDDK